MNWQTVLFDWNQVRAFLVTAEEGSFSAAARALGLTQPTLGRQVAGLEDRLGVTLFERVGRSLALTPSGLELLDHVRDMGEAASRVSLAASGQSQSIEGQVCISATHIMATYFLPPVLKRLRETAPGIEIEVVATDDVSDLRRREADIALRHVRPDQPDLIAKLLRETTGHLYASTEFLDRYGRPDTPEELARLPFVGLERSDRFMVFLNGMGVPVTKNNFGTFAGDGVVAWEMVKQGMGVSGASRELADITPGIEQALPSLDPIPLPIWLVTHRELHTSLRIRLVFDALAEAFS